MQKFFLLAALMFFPLPQSVFAEQAYKNGCDGTDLYECNRLFSKYYTGSSPFPKDEERALHLYETAKRGARDGCEAGRSGMCQIEINLVLRLLVRMPIADSQIASALEHVRTVSEAGCEAGSSAACKMRAGFYADQGVRFFLITQPLQEGQLAENLALDWAQDETEFKIKMSVAAQAEAKTLGPECEDGNARACGQLGMLIADRGLVPNRPYEEIDLLIKGCGADDRADFTCDALNMSVGRLGISKSNREQETQIRADAMQNLADQCSAGKGSFCNALARLDEDRNKRKTWTALACQAGEPRACSDLGQSLYIKYKIKKSEDDLAKAVLNLKRGCDLGDGYACHMLEALEEI